MVRPGRGRRLSACRPGTTERCGRRGRFLLARVAVRASCSTASVARACQRHRQRQWHPARAAPRHPAAPAADGSSAPDAIASAVGASRSGVAQQLRALDVAGLVTRTRSGTAWAGRATCTTSPPMPRACSRPTTTAWRPACWPRSRRSVGTLVEDVFGARRRQAEARLRERMDASLPSDASLEDRVRELAQFQDELGYVSEAQVDSTGSACGSTTARSWDGGRRIRRHAGPSSSCSGRSSTSAWCASAHRRGRPLLRLPDRATPTA